MGEARVIDLFAGCGGLSLGASWAGFRPVLAIERSPMAAETYFYNFHGRGLDSAAVEAGWREHRTLIKAGDLVGQAERGLVVADIWDAVGDDALMARAKALKPDLIAGGPPCQGFSMAGRRVRDDARNSLPWAFLQFVAKTNPRAVIVENVVGISRSFKARGDGEEAPFVQLWHALEQAGRVGENGEDLDGPGYVVQPVEVNARHFGVPQSRPRMMLLAVRADLAPAGIEVNELWSSTAAKASMASPTLTLVPRLGDPRTEDTRDVPCKEAMLDLSGSGYAWDADDDRYGKAPYAAAARRGFDPTADPLPDVANQVMRSHADRSVERFALYQYLRDQGITPGKVMRIGSDFDGEAARAQVIEQLAEAGVALALPESAAFGRPGKDRDLADVIIRLKTRKHSQGALSPDLPSPTVVTLPDDHVHPWHPRIMTVREMARLQSFPDWFEFRSKETTGSHRRRVEVPQYSQVGNAVPPLMAQAVAARLLEIISRP